MDGKLKITRVNGSSVFGDLAHDQPTSGVSVITDQPVITDIGQLSHCELTNDSAILAGLSLEDSEKSHPVVVLKDHKLLVVDSPDSHEKVLIRGQRSAVRKKLQGKHPAELAVERAVLRSWIDSHTDRSIDDQAYSKHQDCESILEKAEALKATDIHIDVEGLYCKIRYRSNGVFTMLNRFSASVGRLIIKAFWETYAADGIKGDFVKDGRFSRTINDTDYLFRLSYGASPSLNIYSTAIRVRNMRDIPSIEVLGYSDVQLKAMKEAQGRAGMILICGSVNSGKSTFQAAWQSLLPSDQYNLEVSDQVEVILPNFTQLQKPNTGDQTIIEEQTKRLYKLPTRHDIDFIAINEIRDYDTAQLMQDLMQLGTPGITSIHAKGWPEAINRLRSAKLGVNAETLFGEGFFNAIAYQTLGRVLCECKLTTHEDSFWDGYFRARLGDALAFRNSRGCERCSGTGISGLTAVAEFIPIVDSNRKLLRDTTNNTAMYAWMNENGVPTIFQHALEKIKALQLDPQMIRQKLGDFDETNIFDQFRPN